MKQKLVVIGNGMTPGRALERIFDAEPDAYDVTIFNAEPRVNYDRIMLSPLLSGEKTYEEIIIHGDGWYIDRGIMLYKGFKVDRIDRRARIVFSGDDESAEYDKLLIATGSNPIVIPVPGHDKQGVVTYRDYDDVEAMLWATQRGQSAVVIGGGLLGLEAAAGLAMQGMKVTVVHLMPTLMERQLDPAAGHLLQKAVEDRGITVLTEANTKEILGGPAVEGVLLDDGTELAADLVVMAVGIRPSVSVAEEAGLEINRGVVVDNRMRTSDPNILAVGECAEFENDVYGLVAPLYQMANVAAETLLGDRTGKPFEKQVLATQLKVTGIDLYSAGDFEGGDDREEIVLRDARRSIYRRLVIAENKLIGTVLYGDTANNSWYLQLIRSGDDISDFRDTMMFGPGYADGQSADVAVASLPDEVEICGCNGVCKGTIVSAINEHDLSTVDEVRTYTKASSSCGTCTGLVEQLLTLTLGDDYKPKAADAVCACTDLGHDDVRRLIEVQRLQTIPDVMQSLHWKSSEGCAKCRPALNYYLLSTWPGVYEDDQQSRFINERVHANIQKDGTYSVVPRMWGGVTSADELRAIADVVDKFEIPTVKLTGGQRIDMLGVRKEDLPAVWADLGDAGLVSGHAYGKALRTVKTCVGSEWCRFGTQDSTGLGVRIERFMWSCWTPAKVKMAVSGCPRNCAEATCKDVGVVCVDSGYEIHIGGGSGLTVRQTELLCKVASEDEVMEIVAAVVQLYRLQGHYLERMYKWLVRVGIESIKEAVVDDSKRRKELYDGFVHSQSFSQRNPWSERVNGVDAHEFKPLAELDLVEVV